MRVVMFKEGTKKLELPVAFERGILHKLEEDAMAGKA